MTNKQSRIDQLNDEAWQLCRENTPRAMQLAKQAQTLSEQADYAAGQAQSVYTLGTCYFVDGQYEKARECLYVPSLVVVPEDVDALVSIF